MTEHVHKWKLKICHDQKIAWFECTWSDRENKLRCHVQLDDKEAERRLNATERLSVEIDVYVENADPKLSVVEIGRVVLEDWVAELKSTDVSSV